MRSFGSVFVAVATVSASSPVHQCPAAIGVAASVRFPDERSVPSLVSQFPRGGSSRQPTWLRKASQMLRPSYRTASNYQKLLQEQRDLLERQLRQTREELAHLRKQVKSNASKSIAVRASNVKAQQGEALRFEETKMLNQQLTELETAMAKLQEMKDRLEALLLEEQEKMAALQVKLEEAETSSEELKAKHEKELELLRAELEAKASTQLAELKKMMKEQMKLALDQQKATAERERQKAILETEQKLQKQAELRLQTEQKKAEEAVEKEKVKMRKLVKALAEREKKLLAAAEKEAAKRTSAGGASSTQASSSSANQKATVTRKTGTVRNPFKWIVQEQRFTVIIAAAMHSSAI